MPEGDTIASAASVLDRWLRGRRVTAARSRGRAIAVGRLVGSTVAGAGARGKHLLITFADDAAERLVLRTHMGMTGSWHVYEAGAPWRRPRGQATIVLEAGDRVAVCFNVPTVELTSEHDAHARSAVAGLGPDVLVDQLDLDEVCRRGARSALWRPIGDLLLDQRVVAGIGNIYRCESMFLRGVHPWTRREALDDAALRGLVLEASALMRASVGSRSGSRSFGGGADRPWVYGRVGRPCRRCGEIVEAHRLGEQARTVFWCPECQPAPSGWSASSAR